MNYRDAIVASVHKIEKTFTKDDLDTVTRTDLAVLVMDVYDILSDSIMDWWERDEAAEKEMKIRVLENFL